METFSTKLPWIGVLSSTPWCNLVSHILYKATVCIEPQLSTRPNQQHSETHPGGDVVGFDGERCGFVGDDGIDVEWFRWEGGRAAAQADVDGAGRVVAKLGQCCVFVIDLILFS